MTKLQMPFNNPTTYDGHSGVDFGQPMNKLILSSAEGIIRWSGYVNDRAGYGVVVEYDGINAEFLYAHQPVSAPRPNRNARVGRGGSLGLVGNTGRSKGPHLHLEVTEGQGAHTYEGVWLYFDKNRVIGDGSASGDSGKPILPTLVESTDEIMKIIREQNGTFWFFNTQGNRIGIRGTNDLTILRRFLKSEPGKEDTFNAAEVDIINSYTR